MQCRKNGVGRLRSGLLLFYQGLSDLFFMDSARRLSNVLTCLRLNIKYWTSPDLNSMTWLGLFTNKTFRKLFPHRDLIISTVSLAIFHPHFVIRIFHPHFIIRLFPSTFYHPHFSIHILSSVFFHPHFPSAFHHLHFSIRHPPSAIRRQPVHTLQRPI